MKIWWIVCVVLVLCTGCGGWWSIVGPGAVEILKHPGRSVPQQPLSDCYDDDFAGLC